MRLTKPGAALAVALLLAGAWSFVSQRRALAALRQELANLHVRLDAKERERARTQQAAAAAESETARLRDRLAVAIGTAAKAPTPTTPPPAPRPPGTATETRAVPANTEANQRRRVGLQQRYGAFLAERGLMPGQVERLIDLFVLQNEILEDVQAATRAANMPGGAEGVYALRNTLNAPLEREVREILGDEGMAAYYRFQSLSYYRLGFIERMAPVFDSAQAALSPAQKDQLATLLAAHDRPERKNPTDISNTSRIDWSAVVPKAAAFLSSAQQAALQSAVAAETARGR